jgi:hypothetical protein
MVQTQAVLTKVARHQEGLSIQCKHHGEHVNWKCYKNNVVCQFCMAERASRYQRRNYLRYLALWTKRRDPASEITEDFLKGLLQTQENRCALTGVEFDEIQRPSVDRKDSRIGYTRANVQLVLFDVNKMKSNLPLDRFIELCIRVAVRGSHGRHE